MSLNHKFRNISGKTELTDEPIDIDNLHWILELDTMHQFRQGIDQYQSECEQYTLLLNPGTFYIDFSLFNIHIFKSNSTGNTCTQSIYH